MAKSPRSNTLIMSIVAVLVLGAAGFGYFRQTAQLDDEKTAPASPEQVKVESALLAPKPNDIILGDANAVVTVVEYSSLSCPHCAHFHQDVLPTLEKEFITPGKVKLVMRHFPLNESAIRAAQLVECAGKNGQKRENFIKVLFSMQQQWAFSMDSLGNLKQIALVGGMDSATFDSCMADKDIETALLAGRQEAETKLSISSTPTFFINGMKHEGEVSVGSFRKAITEAAGGK